MKIIKMLSMVAVVLLMAACGSNGAQSVEQKIKEGSQLTEADYTVMIEYCGNFAKEAQVIQYKINALPADNAQQGSLEDQMASLADKYPYIGTFGQKLTNATKEEVGEKNVELMEKYSSLTWFIAPDWAIGNSALNNVDGFVEDMPSTDSTGVISTGDGVAVGK